MRGHYIETATNSGKRWFNKEECSIFAPIRNGGAGIFVHTRECGKVSYEKVKT